MKSDNNTKISSQIIGGIYSQSLKTNTVLPTLVVNSGLIMNPKINVIHTCFEFLRDDYSFQQETGRCEVTSE